MIVARLSRLQLAPANPAKRAVERFYFLYTAVWGIACALVMLTGLARHWTDRELLPFGLVLGLGAWLIPTFRPHESERELPWYQRTGFKLGAAVTGFAFGMNYLCTQYFFDVLHMHYGFNTVVNIENNPVFLYLLTIAYFSTYCALANTGVRAVRGWLGVSGARLWIAAVPVALVIAFLETVLNANPFMEGLFCFDDMPLMLTFGTLSYGVGLAAAMPVWASVNEHPEQPTPWWRLGAAIAVALVAITATFAALRHGVAPHVTEVVTDAVGLRDFGTSCLGRAPQGE